MLAQRFPKQDLRFADVQAKYKDNSQSKLHLNTIPVPEGSITLHVVQATVVT